MTWNARLAKAVAATLVALLFAAPGAYLLAFTLQLDWDAFQRHLVVPYYFVDQPNKLGLLKAWLFAGAGALLLLALVVALWSRRMPARETGGATLRIGLAVALSLCTAELLARRWQHGYRVGTLEFKTGDLHPRYGWAHTPNLEKTLPVNRQETRITYAFDHEGNRAPHPGAEPDFAAPTVLLAGESISIGHSLQWKDTIAARLSGLLSLQVVTVGGAGYGTDQAALRAEDQLPRYAHPVAVVALFLPVMISRNVQDFRPHLVLRDGALVLVPGYDGLLARSLLRDLLVNNVPWLSEARLEESLRLTAAIEEDLAAKARARGAAILFVVPSFGPHRALAEHREAFIVREVFEKHALPYALVDWEHEIPWDGHPNPEGAEELAQAIAAALQPRLGALRTDPGNLAGPPPAASDQPKRLSP